ncbi:MAG: rhomboid family intramembrane serine protease [Bacteroidales bacterium]|nr:MAG: rhomboid family intramembrane serine protease [Bacteroidales bacterium]
MPPVVKNLILINVILFVATIVLKGSFGYDISQYLALFHIKSEYFRPFQFVTHMFMHGGLTHIFFNMFALWMFGRVLESVWGPRRFLFYYLVTGLGAALVHMTVLYIQYVSLASQMSQEQLEIVMSEGYRIFSQNQNFVDPLMGEMNILLNVRTVGASGAVFGILLAFGMLFPNTQLMLLFPPIPIKAKYFVIIYGGIELWLAFTQPGSNIAHFAHVGGMLFGFLLIKYWKKDRRKFY